MLSSLVLPNRSRWPRQRAIPGANDVRPPNRTHPVTEPPVARRAEPTPTRRKQPTSPAFDKNAAALDRLDIHSLTDRAGTLLALWDRHAMLFTLDGADNEILVIRARPHATPAPEWTDRSYRVGNEWNHARRFCKAYLGDPPAAANSPSTPRCRSHSSPDCARGCVHPRWARPGPRRTM